MSTVEVSVKDFLDLIVGVSESIRDSPTAPWLEYMTISLPGGNVVQAYGTDRYIGILGTMPTVSGEAEAPLSASIHTGEVSELVGSLKWLRKSHKGLRTISMGLTPNSVELSLPGLSDPVMLVASGYLKETPDVDVSQLFVSEALPGPIPFFQAAQVARLAKIPTGSHGSRWSVEAARPPKGKDLLRFRENTPGVSWTVVMAGVTPAEDS